MPLAHRLAVNPEGLGLADLAGVIATTLRRRGGHVLVNLMRRGGEGPSYAVILARLCRWCAIAPGADTEQTELSLLRWWADRAWGRLDDAQRDALGDAIGERPLPASPPEDITTLTVRGRLGELVSWRVGLGTLFGPARLLLLLVLPLWPLLVLGTAFWLGRPRNDKLMEAVLEVARLRQVVRHRLTVGVVGSPSSGKDAAISAIFSLPTGNISPIAGSTRAVSITRLPSATALYVVNTPGMGDVVEAVTEEARQILHHIDLFLYIVNAQGGVQERELEDWRRCVDFARPVLAIVNKIDTLRPADRERYLADARGKLAAPPEDFLAAAFDPLPQLSQAPIGVAAVRGWIEAQVIALGKEPDELPWR